MLQSILTGAKLRRELPGWLRRVALVAAGLAVSWGQTVPVAVVGCPSDGQLGPLAVPATPAVPVPQLPSAVASELALYHAEGGPAVLAPRGWVCFGVYGSAGSALYVAPEPLDAKKLLGTGGGWRGFTGPVVSARWLSGTTSGRFGVAQVIARLFPSRMGFVRQVAGEAGHSLEDFPSGPFPGDRIVRRNEGMAEFTTRADFEGLGTLNSLLRPSGAAAIHGVAMLTEGEAPDLRFLSVRLPVRWEHLLGVIRENFESAARVP